jgi:hypothetical protein
VTWQVAVCEAVDIEQAQVSNAAYHVFRQGVSTYLLTQGSIVPTQAFQISVTPSATSIAISWSAASLLRADGSTLSVSAGSQTYSTGINPNTTYWIYAYIDNSTGTVGFANPNPPGTTSSYTFAAQTGFDGRINLTPLSVTTPASGTGGTVTGGDGGSCPEEHECVDVQDKGVITAGQVQANDYIRGYLFGSSTDIYRRVLLVRRQSCAAWWIVNGHRVSPCEPVFVNGTWMPAHLAPGATFDPSVGVKIEITVEAVDDQDDEHNFWLVEGTPLLVHNTNVLPRS